MRSIRASSATLLLAVVLGGWMTTAAATPSGPVPDTTGILTSWRIDPASPCTRDPVFMIVRGFVATPCDSFMDAEALGPLHVRIRRQVYVDRQCFAAPVQFYPVPVALGRFTAGPHMGLVDVETVERRSDGSVTRATQQFRFDFVVAAECPEPPPPPGPLPYVASIGTDPPHPCAGRPTTLVMSGFFKDGCGRLVDAYVRDPGHVELTLKVQVLRDTLCTLAPEPWRQGFDLGLLPPGTHRTDITLHIVATDSAGSTFRRETHYGSHEFFVREACDSLPPPGPGPLPYVERIVVGREGICGPAPACPGDSIPFHVSGVFPDNCLRFRRIVLIPSPATVFPPLPPTVRIIVDDGACMGRPCFNRPEPWFASVNLPPMPPGGRRLDVELAQVSCSDSYPPGRLFRTTVPFTVADSCPAPVCLTAGFARPPGGFGACNATVSKTQAAELTFLVRPTVALAGLQGEFHLSPPVLGIRRIEPTGPAVGMLLEWTLTDDGARFVLVAPGGAPIPPSPPPEAGQPDGWPVLRVTVASEGRAEVPGRTRVTPDNLIGSDIGGRAVLRCPPPPCASLDLRVDPGSAIVCTEHACDFNADGLEDVRDLVLMIHCAIDAGACPPDAATRFDCDGDGSFAIADVLCCARHVLRGPPCPDCPPDTGQVRPEPGVTVSLDTPEATASGIAIPMRIGGAERLGGVLLTLEAPLDRYDVVGIEADPPGRWLTLDEVRDGRLVVGLLALGGGADPPPRREDTFRLILALRPGQAAGGQVMAVDGAFSGPDGMALGVDLGHPSQALPGAGRVTLGPNRPNPFSTGTEFTLELVEAADVVLGVYDLRGRAVAILHHAPLQAGPHLFRWDGQRSDGRPAPEGVYFYRATVAGKAVARKLILMRGN